MINLKVVVVTWLQPLKATLALRSIHLRLSHWIAARPEQSPDNDANQGVVDDGGGIDAGRQGGDAVM